MNTSVSCPNCGESLHEGEQTCSRCGAANFPCATCGNALLPTDQFCARCGTSRSGSAPFAETLLEDAVSPWDEVMVRLRDVTTGEFQILRELGRGGMAAVYLAHDIALNRKVAIKVMSPGLLMGPGMVERFRTEAVTVANLSHRHIVTIHAVRQAAGLHYFVMQLIPGASLERIIREAAPLPLPVVQAVLFQVGSALNHAHRRGVVHRDVKPPNILLDHDGDAVVTDFGIAKVIESPSQTLTGTTVGTPAYMSPEQCWSREVTPASDQYSLGIVAYEMLTGRPPFTGPTLGVLRAHTEDAPAPIREARSDCPQQIADAVHRMLEKEPSQRWPTVSQAVAALGGRQASEGEPVREALAKLAQLGPDHPLPEIRTPHSPIPIRQPPAPPSRKPPIEEVKPRVKVRDPGASEAEPAPQPAPVASPSPGPVEDVWRAALRRWWWTIPTAAALGIAVWWGWPSPTPLDTGRRPPDSLVPNRPDTMLEPIAKAVELTEPPARILVGDEFPLDATARDERGEILPDRPVAWSSDRPSVARVSPEGVVTAVRAGRATITAALDDGRGTVTFSVREPRVVSVKVKPGAVTLKVGDTTRLSAVAVSERGAPAQGVVVWESSSNRVATVSSAGVVTAMAAGSARITAYAGGSRGAGVLTVTQREGEPQRPTGRAIVRMLVQPWANVTIDGVDRGKRVHGEDTLAAGVRHRFRFERDGFVTVDTIVTLRAGEQRRLTIPMIRRTQ